MGSARAPRRQLGHTRCAQATIRRVYPGNIPDAKHTAEKHGRTRGANHGAAMANPAARSCRDAKPAAHDYSLLNSGSEYFGSLLGVCGLAVSSTLLLSGVIRCWNVT